MPQNHRGELRKNNAQTCNGISGRDSRDGGRKQGQTEKEMPKKKKMKGCQEHSRSMRERVPSKAYESVETDKAHSR